MHRKDRVCDKRQQQAYVFCTAGCSLAALLDAEPFFSFSSAFFAASSLAFCKSRNSTTRLSLLERNTKKTFQKNSFTDINTHDKLGHTTLSIASALRMISFIVSCDGSDKSNDAAAFIFLSGTVFVSASATTTPSVHQILKP
jgi:hypothetical protein